MHFNQLFYISEAKEMSRECCRLCKSHHHSISIQYQEIERASKRLMPNTENQHLFPGCPMLYRPGGRRFALPTLGRPQLARDLRVPSEWSPWGIGILASASHWSLAHCPQTPTERETPFDACKCIITGIRRAFSLHVEATAIFKWTAGRPAYPGDPR